MVSPNQCVGSDPWYRPRFTEFDCTGALGHFYYEEMPTGGLEKLEFLGVHRDPITQLGTMQTPRKYKFGK